MATTTNLGLTLPAVGADDDTWGGVNNTVHTGVDAVFKADGTGTSVGVKVGSGKTLNALDGTVVLGDAGLTLKDTADPTKIAAFQCSGITAGQTRTFTLPDSSGTLALASSAAPQFAVCNAADQSISGSTFTKVTWGTEILDTASGFASNEYTIPLAGKYEFLFKLQCNASSCTAVVPALYKNGSVVDYGWNAQASASGDFSQVLTATLDLALNDVIAAYVRIDGTSPVIVGTSFFISRFSGKWLSA